MSREKALKRINEYLAKQEPQKVELALVDDIEKIVNNFSNALGQAGRINNNMVELWNEINRVQDSYDSLRSNFSNSNGAKNELGYLMQQYDRLKATYQNNAKELGVDTNPAVIKKGDAEYKKAKKLFNDLEISQKAAKKFI